MHPVTFQSSQINPCLVSADLHGIFTYSLEFLEHKDVLRFRATSVENCHIVLNEFSNIRDRIRFNYLTRLKDFLYLNGQLAFEKLQHGKTLADEFDHGRLILSYLLLKNRKFNDPAKALALLQGIIQMGMQEYLEKKQKKAVVVYEISQEAISHLRILLNVVPQLDPSLVDEAQKVAKALYDEIRRRTQEEEILYSKVLLRVTEKSLSAKKITKEDLAQLKVNAYQIPVTYYKLKALIRICECAFKTQTENSLEKHTVERIIPVRKPLGAPLICPGPSRLNPIRVSTPTSKIIQEEKYDSIVGELWGEIHRKVDRIDHSFEKRTKKWRIYLDIFQLAVLLPTSRKVRGFYFDAALNDKNFPKDDVIKKYQDKLFIFEESLNAHLSKNRKEKLLEVLKNIKGNPGEKGTLMNACLDTQTKCLPKCAILEARFNDQISIPEQSDCIPEHTVFLIKVIHMARQIEVDLKNDKGKLSSLVLNLNEILEEMLRSSCLKFADLLEVLDIIKTCTSIAKLISEADKKELLRKNGIKLLESTFPRLAQELLNRHDEMIKLLRKIHSEKWLPISTPEFVDRLYAAMKLIPCQGKLRVEALIKLSEFQAEIRDYIGERATLQDAAMLSIDLDHHSSWSETLSSTSL